MVNIRIMIKMYKLALSITMKTRKKSKDFRKYRRNISQMWDISQSFYRIAWTEHFLDRSIKTCHDNDENQSCAPLADLGQVSKMRCFTSISLIHLFGSTPCDYLIAHSEELNIICETLFPVLLFISLKSIHSLSCNSVTFSFDGWNPEFMCSCYSMDVRSRSWLLAAQRW